MVLIIVFSIPQQGADETTDMGLLHHLVCLLTPHCNAALKCITSVRKRTTV